MSQPRPRDHRDAAQDIARELPYIAAQLAGLKGEEMNWLRDPNLHAPPRHRLGNAHAAVEVATVEARRGVRMNDGDARRRSWWREVFRFN